MTLPARKSSGPWTLESLAEYVSEIVAKESGNVLGDGQQSMVASRLRKRLMDLGGVSPEAYYKHLRTNYERETVQLVSMLTTHHTFFFREFSHFEFLLKHLEDLAARARQRGDNKIRVLSAACSRGQEVYSLAMFLKRHLKDFPGMSFEIYGTDIDPESVKVAQNGVYPYKEVKSIPQLYLQGNWQRGTGEISHFARVKKELKKFCSFGVMNLMKTKEHLGSKKYDIILCRNVFIYFKNEDIKSIVSNLKNHLDAGGYLLTGLSESLKELGVEGMNTHAPSVYSFGDKAPAPKARAASAGSRASRPSASLPPAPMRVLVVDDSPSVVKLLSKVFESDPLFELAGTAANGLEAKEFLKNNKVDAMTLDIHMPEMDGVEYLKDNFGPNHPKVVVVSSASREDTRYAQQTLRRGASDFVEKPALNNLAKRADEIKNKLRMAFLNEVGPGGRNVGELDKSFQKDFVIDDSGEKARLFFANFSDLKKVKSSLGELKGKQPPVFLFFEGNGNYLDMIREELGLWNAQVWERGSSPKEGRVYLCDFDSHMGPVAELVEGKTASCAVFGICSRAVEDVLANLKPGQILLEDMPGVSKAPAFASDVFPWTSFAHVGTEFLAKR